MKHAHGTSMGDDGEVVTVLREKNLTDDEILNYFKIICTMQIYITLFSKKVALPIFLF